ncbi:Tuftelin-interacting protein 11 [Chytridiales sp. JEL 0842]|nr:Tuftelin-interacting protein 11 [Chytridiales sp. JEL 0842]
MDDGGDSSDDDNRGSDDERDLDDMDPDEREEYMLFRGPTKKRRQRTRDQDIYGVWEDEANDRRGSQRQRVKPGKDSGISFVTAQSKASIPKQNESDDESDNDDDESSSSSSSSSERTAEKRSDAEDIDKMDIDQDSNVDDSDDSEEREQRQPRNRDEDNEDEDEDANQGHQGLGMTGGMAGLGLGFSTASSSTNPSVDQEQDETNRPALNGSSQSTTKGRAGIGAQSYSTNSSTTFQQQRGGQGGLGLGWADSSIPTEFGTSRKPQTQRPQPTLQQQQPKTSLSADNNDAKPAPSVPLSKDFAKFEKLNKGIGLKYLEKMGYVPGHGLGKDGRGIVEPIDVKLRPQKMGLGHRGFDERTEAIKRQQAEKKARGEMSESSEDEESKDKKKEKKEGARSEAWKKGQKKKKKTTYKTANDIIQEQQELLERQGTILPTSNTQSKIIDMTGPQAKELADISEATHAAATKHREGPLMELRYNVGLLVAEAETDLVRLTKAMKIEEQSAKRASEEAAALKAKINADAKLISSMKLMKQFVQEMYKIGTELLATTAKNSMDPSGKAPLTFEGVEAAFGGMFAKFETEFYVEYLQFRLDAFVVASISPLLKRLVLEWDPLVTPDFGVKTFAKWRKLLRVSGYSQSKKSFSANSESRMSFGDSGKSASRQMTPYESMLYTIWLPKIRQALNNRWDAHDPDPAIALVEAWFPSTCASQISIKDGIPTILDPTSPHIIPPWLYLNIITQLVLPKIRNAIDNWDPRKDPIPIHTWLFPWLPVLDDRFQEIFDLIRRKFAISLSRWQAKDPSALRMVQPWLEVFPDSIKTTFINKTILPELIRTIRMEFTVNPASQDNEPLTWVLTWQPYITPSNFSHLLETEFFPKWLRVLHAWLKSSNRDYEEISNWYMAWKTFWPADVVSLPGVGSQFKVGLDLMNRAIQIEGTNLDLGPCPEVKPWAYSEEKERYQESKKSGAAKLAGLPELMRRKEVESSFKDLLERMAADRNMVMVPAPQKATETGKPVFRLVVGGVESKGGLFLYVDDGVVYVYGGGGKWEPMAVDEVFVAATKASKP